MYLSTAHPLLLSGQGFPSRRVHKAGLAGTFQGTAGAGTPPELRVLPSLFPPQCASGLSTQSPSPFTHLEMSTSQLVCSVTDPSDETHTGIPLWPPRKVLCVCPGHSSCPRCPRHCSLAAFRTVALTPPIPEVFWPTCPQPGDMKLVPSWVLVIFPPALFPGSSEVKNQECFSSSVTFFFTSVYNRTQGFFFFFLNRIFKNIFIYFWLCWVFVATRGLSLVAASWGATLHCRPRAQRCQPQQPPEGFQQARPCELS